MHTMKTTEVSVLTGHAISSSTGGGGGYPYETEDDFYADDCHDSCHDEEEDSSFDPLDPSGMTHDDSETDAPPNDFDDDFDDDEPPTAGPAPSSSRGALSSTSSFSPYAVLRTSRHTPSRLFSTARRTTTGAIAKKTVLVDDLRWENDLSETDTDDP